ncbi:hypothetical protein NM688_g4701 [Phlebia brevispora]|uniref:Uncharacterized protein n=1 Tax=Phlebia brevispora TaxID=194682 RepID=A0ACC1T2E1_9APHY|nr:hypothetical protein NM688_g4701 [Phlebia brevispora]
MSQTQQSEKPRFRVAVCGGGITGLLLTIALSKYEDIEVQVYEAAESFKEIGAGVTIWGRAWSILSRLGLAHDLRQAEDIPSDGQNDPTLSFDLRKSDQPEEGFLWKALRLPYTCLYVHRAHFLDVLVKHLPEGVTNLRKRLITYSNQDSGSIELQFSDGTKATCDLLVGCDGIRSAVRKQMFEDEAVRQLQPELVKYVDPVFSGSFTYRAVFSMEVLKGREGEPHPSLNAPTIYCGKGKSVITYPIAGGSLCNFGALVTDVSAAGKEYGGPWVTESSAQELLDCYAGWEPKVQDLLKLIPPEKPVTKWVINQVHPLPFSVIDNVALVGDAAHAMTPYQGAGAAQGIEDAYVLAGLLGHPLTTLATLHLALKAYEHVRLPMGKHVLQQSKRQGWMVQQLSEYGDDFEVIGTAVDKAYDWVRGPDPHSELERALRWCYPNENATAQL